MGPEYLVSASNAAAPVPLSVLEPLIYHLMVFAFRKQVEDSPCHFFLSFSIVRKLISKLHFFTILSFGKFRGGKNRARDAVVFLQPSLNSGNEYVQRLDHALSLVTMYTALITSSIFIILVQNLSSNARSSLLHDYVQISASIFFIFKAHR